MKKTMMLSFMAALTLTACSGRQNGENPLPSSNFDLSVAPPEPIFISMPAVAGWPIIP